jgi:hypothetical protein
MVAYRRRDAIEGKISTAQSEPTLNPQIQLFSFGRTVSGHRVPLPQNGLFTPDDRHESNRASRTFRISTRASCSLGTFGRCSNPSSRCRHSFNPCNPSRPTLSTLSTRSTPSPPHIMPPLHHPHQSDQQRGTLTPLRPSPHLQVSLHDNTPDPPGSIL